MSISLKTRDLIRWLSASDPCTNHSSACDKHEPSTGNWLLQSEDFLAWLKGKTTSLWLHGIPDAGKTFCGKYRVNHYAYFYFEFNDPIKRTVDGMARSLVTQLSVIDGETPEPVIKLYQTYHEGKEQPITGNLMETLIAISKPSSVGRVFLMLDAVDECAERTHLLDAIRLLTEKKVSILLTSRNEREIFDGLRDRVNVTIDISKGGLDNDIALHVQNRLQYDRRLQKWPPKVREKMQTALIQGAQGIYSTLSEGGYLGLTLRAAAWANNEAMVKLL